MHPILVAVVSLAVVMAGMTFLMLLLETMRRIGRRQQARKALAEPDRPPDEALDNQLVAVLAAAAREAIGAPVKLYQVHVHRGDSVERWSRAGRMDIMVSHRVEPKR